MWDVGEPKLGLQISCPVDSEAKMTKDALAPHFRRLVLDFVEAEFCKRSDYYPDSSNEYSFCSLVSDLHYLHTFVHRSDLIFSQ